MHGTPEVREQAVVAGYRPTAAEKTKTPTRLFGSFREDYTPSQRVGGDPSASIDDMLFAPKEAKKPYAGFELPQTAVNADATTLAARVGDRLASGRNVVRQRMTEQRTLEELGMVPKRGAAGEPLLRGADRKTLVKDPAALTQLLAGDEKLTRIKPLAAISDMGRDALFVNSLPHMGNVGTLGYLAGGLPLLARGAKNMTRMKPETARRLEEFGGASHFSRESTPLVDRIPIAGPLTAGIRHGSQRMLDKFETGMRAGRLEQLDKTAPKMSEFAKAQRVREDLGDYRATSRVVNVLKAGGAPFPQYRLGVIPGAVGRAVARNPQRVEGYTRATKLGNEDLLPGAGYEIVPNKPVDEFAKLLVDPKAYLGSPSTLGPAANLLRGGGQPQSFSPAEAAKEIARSYVPFVSPIEDVTGTSPFKSKAPNAVRGAAGVFGAYAKNAQSAFEKSIRDVMVRDGVDRFEAEKRVRRQQRLIQRYTR